MSAELSRTSNTLFAMSLQRLRDSDPSALVGRRIPSACHPYHPFLNMSYASTNINSAQSQHYIPVGQRHEHLLSNSNHRYPLWTCLRSYLCPTSARLSRVYHPCTMPFYLAVAIAAILRSSHPIAFYELTFPQSLVLIKPARFSLLSLRSVSRHGRSGDNRTLLVWSWLRI